MQIGDQITFSLAGIDQAGEQSPNRTSLTGSVLDAQQTLGRVSAKAVDHFGLSGVVDHLDLKSGQLLSPETPLANIPSQEGKARVGLAPRLTPACMG